MATTETRITQLPDDLQDVIYQMVHQSQMKDIVAQLKQIVEDERSYSLYILACDGWGPNNPYVINFDITSIQCILRHKQ